MEPYIQVLDEITEKEPDVEMVFHEILDEIHVHPENILDIWLKDISFGIRFQVKTIGRKEDYNTVILESEFSNFCPIPEIFDFSPISRLFSFKSLKKVTFLAFSLLFPEKYGILISNKPILNQMLFSQHFAESRGEKSLIIPCSADKRDFKIICAGRSGGMEIFTYYDYQGID